MAKERKSDLEPREPDWSEEKGSDKLMPKEIMDRIEKEEKEGKEK
jgi:hypothetical protein